MNEKMKKLTISYGCGMFNVDSTDIAFALIEDMYTTGNGYGCQLEDETKRPAIEKMCFEIYKVIKAYQKEVSNDET